MDKNSLSVRTIGRSSLVAALASEPQRVWLEARSVKRFSNDVTKLDKVDDGIEKRGRKLHAMIPIPIIVSLEDERDSRSARRR